MKLIYRLSFLICLLNTQCQVNNSFKSIKSESYSGVYPHLAYYNEEGECGTGAVVSWADRLWVNTYGPHLPFGSSDKLYEITPNLEQIIRTESIGGTPANRMIHQESEQLFIGPYAISKLGEVRTIPYDVMPGRHTGNARHLTDPENKIYYGTMEEGFYEVDVRSLEVKTLYVDGNVTRKEGQMAQEAELLLGAHGKGLYSGQGVLVYSNNGETGTKALEEFDIKSGALYEWNGKEWSLIRRNQFVEVTGPGGIYGNSDPLNDPIWATGWDHKSILLGVRDQTLGWSFYRIPKASHSYDGAHGWNTEWPRIRDVGTEENPDYLMTMHGMFWSFPKDFHVSKTAGIRPRSAYLKVIGDFTRWKNQLVFGTDDSAQKEFLNKRSVKGDIGGHGQSNSNLWFGNLDLPDNLGPTTANGSIWISEDVNANLPSDPMLFSGWEHVTMWLKNEGNQDVVFQLEIDKLGLGNWEHLQYQTLGPGQAKALTWSDELKAEWIRIKINKNTKATVHLSYSNQEDRERFNKSIFTGVRTEMKERLATGLLYGLGKNRKSLGVAAKFNESENKDFDYYELDGDMNLIKKDDLETLEYIDKNFAIPKNAIEVDDSSVLIKDDKGRRWRLPLGNEKFTDPSLSGDLRICREVVTERDLFNSHGTFYELPAENADGFAKIRPISSHNLLINDFVSYRGLMIFSGVDPKVAPNNPHIILSEDKKLALWAGAIDDLWKLGKPIGRGGPWKDTSVLSNIPSDPYLFGFYDHKKLELSHQSSVPVTFQIQFEPIGHGPWMTWKEITILPGDTFRFEFPEGFEARWIRFISQSDCIATAWLTYD
jgi:hypothetical protein